MKKLNLILVSLLATLLLVGCDDSNHRHARRHRPVLPEKEVVQSYRVHRSAITNQAVLNAIANVAKNVAEAASSTTSDDWVYYYIIFDSNTSTYYSAASASPATSYSSLSWSPSQTAPVETSVAESLGQAEVPTSELGQATTEISEGYSSIPESNSLDSMEGVPDSTSESSADSSADSSSGDGGGGDGGGGDGGGGDGGGGDGGGGDGGGGE